MKRENYESSSGACGKGKMPEMEDQPDAGEDELLAAFVYKVGSSEADVALNLEPLENAMGSSAANDEALFPYLDEDTNYYNPSDLSGWLESMLCETNAPPPPVPHQQLVQDFVGADISFPESSTVTTVNFTPTNYNFNPVLSEEVPRERIRTTPSSSCSGTMGKKTTEVSSMPVVIADTQAAGIRLVQSLMACAEAVQQENLDAASVLLKQIPVLLASQSGAMRKVAGFFADELARRIYRHLPQQDDPLDAAFADTLPMHFYESCPYLKFAHSPPTKPS